MEKHVLDTNVLVQDRKHRKKQGQRTNITFLTIFQQYEVINKKKKEIIMVKKDRMMYQHVMKHIKEEDIDVLKKMYPDIDIADKYIVFLYFELYWQLATSKIETIEAKLKIMQQTESSELIELEDHPLPKYKIRRPYPNKNYRVLSMCNGRKVSDLGIPLVFDCKEKLKKLQTITCRWEIIGEHMNYYIYVMYDLSFETSVKEGKIYGIHSRDMTVYDGVDAEEEQNTMFGGYIGEYDVVKHATYNESKGGVIKQFYVNDNRINRKMEDNIKKISINKKPHLQVLFNQIQLDMIAIHPEKYIAIDIYYAKESLKSDVCSCTIHH